MTDTQKSLTYRLGLIVLLVLVAYGSILSHGFVWDDFDIIVHNPLLASLENIPRFFLTEDKVVAATGYYRPITYLSFALDRALWGVNPLGFNITNLLLHIWSSPSFYLAVREIFRKEKLAFYAAIVFALHPLAVRDGELPCRRPEHAAVCLSSRPALLFSSSGRGGSSVLFFTLAIFSKEFALLLPAVFLFYDCGCGRRRSGCRISSLPGRRSSAT